MKICSLCKREWENAFRVCPIDGAPLQETPGSPDAYIGKTMGPCRIIEKICDADLGPIYKAEEPKLGVVAVQITPSHRLGSPVLLEAYADAVSTAVKLNHPHVVRIYGMETAQDGSAAVIMELVNGTDLGSYRRQNPNLSFQEASTLARMIAEGVLAAHRLSMVHGALHPTRILVTPDRSIKVGGFHRNALREGVDGQSATPANLPYLAPEQVGVLQDAAGLDYRTDIYSLGVILYELLTGRLPYNATNIQDFAAILEAAPPLEPSFLNAAIPPLLSRVVMQALSRHPTDRQESMDQFLRELDAARQPVREPERPPVTPYAEPRHPPSAQDSGLFAPPSAREVKRDSTEDLWPETGRNKDSTESGRFTWFKTRVVSSKRHGRSTDLQTHHDSDDSSFTDSRSGGNRQDDSEIHTVVVSGREKAKRRNLWETITDFSYRNQDGTGTDRLPRRHVYSKLYWIVPICVIVVAAIVVALFYFFSSGPPMGTVEVDTEPPNADLQVLSQNLPDANWEHLGRTPQKFSRPIGKYRIRVELEDYTPEEQQIEITKTTGAPIKIQLNRKPLIAVNGATDSQVVAPPGGEVVVPRVVAQGDKSPNFEQPFAAALSKRIFFPPAEDNAWKYIQMLAGNPSPALDKALTAFCTALENYENESLRDRRWKDIRDLMTQVQSHSPDLACANKLRDKFRDAQKQYIDEFRPQVRAALEHQNYVTPAHDCALFYVRSILSCDDTDSPAKTWEQQIFDYAWAQAQKLSKQRHHQEALSIYNELDSNYPNPPLGKDSVVRAIQKENRRLDLFNQLNVTVSIAVRHRHPRRWIVKKGECTGTLIVSGLEIEYRTVEEDDRFKMNYDELTAAIKPEKDRKDKIEIQGNGIKGGKIELEQMNRTSKPSLGEVCDRINQFRDLYTKYKGIE